MRFFFFFAMVIGIYWRVVHIVFSENPACATHVDHVNHVVIFDATYAKVDLAIGVVKVADGQQFVVLGEDGAALVGLAHFLEEHEILSKGNKATKINK